MKAHLLLIPLGIATLFVSCKSSRSAGEGDANLPESLRVSTQAASTSETKNIWPPASDFVDADLLKENYLVVLDDSGSMGGAKIKQAKEALLSLAKTLPAEHNLGLVLLNSSNPIELGQGSREAFIKAVKATRANGGTPLRRVTAKSYEMITKKASSQRGYGTYHMIIVTDGDSNDGSPMPLVKSIVTQTPIQVHVIGFHLKDHEMNQPRFVDYQTAGNSQELSRAFEAVAAETNEFSDPREFSR